MGDASDYAIVERFLRTEEGKEHLADLRKSLLGARIIDVTFTNNTNWVGTHLRFDNDKVLTLHEMFYKYDVDALLKRFRFILDREYYIDFPHYKPR